MNPASSRSAARMAQELSDTTASIPSGPGAVLRPGHRTRSPRPLVPQPPPVSRRHRCMTAAVRGGANPATAGRLGGVRDEQEWHAADARDPIACPWRRIVAALHPGERCGRRRRDGGYLCGGDRGMRYAASAGRSGRTSWPGTCHAHGDLPASRNPWCCHRRRRGVATTGNAVLRVDPRTDRASQVLSDPGASLTGIAFGAGSLWVEDAAGILRVDPVTGRITARIGVHAALLSFGEGALWALGYIGGGPLVRIDPATNARADLSPPGGQDRGPGGGRRCRMGLDDLPGFRLPAASRPGHRAGGRAHPGRSPVRAGHGW